MKRTEAESKKNLRITEELDKLAKKLKRAPSSGNSSAVISNQNEGDQLGEFAKVISEKQQQKKKILLSFLFIYFSFLLFL